MALSLGRVSEFSPITSELLAHQSRDRIKHFSDYRPVLEIRPRHQPGPALVVLENDGLLRSKDGVVDVQVGFIVQPVIGAVACVIAQVAKGSNVNR